jgi:hypothetical protein
MTTIPTSVSAHLIRFLKDRLVAPSSIPFSGMSPGEMSELERLIEVNRLQPLMHTLQTLEDEIPFTADYDEQLRSEAYRRMLFGNHQVKQAVAFAQALENKGIRCICMRGPFASLDLYGDAGIRPYNDIDLLVPRSKAMDAWRVACDRGYELFSAHMPVRYFLRHHLHWQLKQPQQNVICDLHWAVEHPYRLYRIDYAVVFADAVKVQTGQGSWYEPAPGHHILLTALHIRKHVDDLHALSLQSDGLDVLLRRGELLHLIDLALLIQRHGAVLNWEKLASDARRWNCLDALSGSLACVKRAFDLSVPDGFMDRLHIAVPDWQIAGETRALPQGRLPRALLGALAKKGGFRVEKIRDAYRYFSPPDEYFSDQPGTHRSWLRLRHQCHAARVLAFAAVDTTLATCIAQARGMRSKPTQAKASVS